MVPDLSWEIRAEKEKVEKSHYSGEETDVYICMCMCIYAYKCIYLSIYIYIYTL